MPTSTALDVRDEVPVPPLLTVSASPEMSVNVKDLNVGAAAEPVEGPAKTVFAFWLANVTVRVPDVVTGLLLTVKTLGILKSTLVTVPLPVPAPMAVLKAAPVSKLTDVVLICMYLIAVVDNVNKASPRAEAPKSVLKSEADRAVTVLSELIRINVVAPGLLRVKMLEPTVFAPRSALKLLALCAVTVLSALILIKLVDPGLLRVKRAEPTVVAPRSDLNSDADLAETVLAEFIVIKLVELGSVNLNKFAPTVVAPRFVNAAAAVVAFVPPFAIATIPVTFVALPDKLAVIVPALKLPEASLETIVLTVFALVALLATVKVALVDAFAEKLAEPVRPTPETASVRDASLISVVIASVPVDVGNVRVLLEGVDDAIIKLVPLDVPAKINPLVPIVLFVNV